MGFIFKLNKTVQGIKFKPSVEIFFQKELIKSLDSYNTIWSSWFKNDTFLTER